MSFIQSLFSRRAHAGIKNKVWTSTAARDAALAAWLAAHPGGQVISWFRQECDQLRHALASPCVVPADAIFTSGNPVIFAGRYPLQSVEAALMAHLGITIAEAYISLDSPLMLRFGGSKIAEMMQRMGMKEDEQITHPLIDSAISTAQEKLFRKCGNNEIQSHSESEWITLNAA